MKPLSDHICKKGIALALKAAQMDEIPVGAVIFDSNTFSIITSAHNTTVSKCNILAHAEVLAIQKACKKLKKTNLTGYSIYTTLEPCAMCAMAISWAKLDGVYFGATDPKSGGVTVGAKIFDHPQTHHKPKISSGHRGDEAGTLMSSFFKNKRKKTKSC